VEPKGSINPVYLISAMVAVMMEVLLLAAFIFIIRSAPYEVKSDPPIKIQLIAPAAITEKKEETIPETVIPERTIIEEKKPESEPDPLFDRLSDFQPVKSIPVKKTATILPQTAEIKKAIEPQTYLFELPSNLQVSASNPEPVKRINQVYRENEYRTLRFEELREYAFPNYDEVAAALQKDYNDLLHKQSTRSTLLTGEVVVLLRFDKTGFPTVELVNSSSPELTNIVMRNLKLLRSGQNTEEMTFQVSMLFKIE
jgi:hypothetical protein